MFILCDAGRNNLNNSVMFGKKPLTHDRFLFVSFLLSEGGNVASCWWFLSLQRCSAHLKLRRNYTFSQKFILLLQNIKFDTKSVKIKENQSKHFYWSVKFITCSGAAAFLNFKPSWWSFGYASVDVFRQTNSSCSSLISSDVLAACFLAFLRHPG